MVLSSWLNAPQFCSRLGPSWSTSAHEVSNSLVGKLTHRPLEPCRDVLNQSLSIDLDVAEMQYDLARGASEHRLSRCWHHLWCPRWRIHDAKTSWTNELMAGVRILKLSWTRCGWADRGHSNALSGIERHRRLACFFLEMVILASTNFIQEIGRIPLLPACHPQPLPSRSCAFAFYALGDQCPIVSWSPQSLTHSSSSLVRALKATDHWPQRRASEVVCYLPLSFVGWIRCCQRRFFATSQPTAASIHIQPAARAGFCSFALFELRICMCTVVPSIYDAEAAEERNPSQQLNDPLLYSR